MLDIPMNKKLMRALQLLAALLLCSVAAWAQQVPAAIYTDPPVNKAHPAAMTVLHIPSHGVLINGLLYSPPGAGPHPTFVLCHGLPGNEKNLDLAQAVRRAGWNAVTFNYRGSWGSPGVFRFAQNLEDADAVLAYLREPKTAAQLGIDTKRMVLAGHSMGGWVTAKTASHDQGLMGAILISAANMAPPASAPQEKVVAMMADDMESLAGVTAESMANELRSHAKEFDMTASAAGLKSVPLLVITANDGLKPDADAVMKKIAEAGGHRVTSVHMDTDHSYSDHRIALETAIVKWLAGLR